MHTNDNYKRHKSYNFNSNDFGKIQNFPDCLIDPNKLKGKYGKRNSMEFQFKLTSNSIFAYQEYDKFSNLACDGEISDKTKSTPSNLQNGELLSNSFSKESSDSEEYEMPITKPNKNKRLSDGMIQFNLKSKEAFNQILQNKVGSSNNSHNNSSNGITFDYPTEKTHYSSQNLSIRNFFGNNNLNTNTNVSESFSPILKFKNINQFPDLSIPQMYQNDFSYKNNQNYTVPIHKKVNAFNNNSINRTNNNANLNISPTEINNSKVDNSNTMNINPILNNNTDNNNTGGVISNNNNFQPFMNGMKNNFNRMKRKSLIIAPSFRANVPQTTGRKFSFNFSASSSFPFPINNSSNMLNLNPINPQLIKNNIINTPSMVNSTIIPFNQSTNLENNVNNISMPKDDILIIENLKHLDSINYTVILEKLEENKEDINFLKTFFSKIKDNLVNFIIHQQGNYIIQKYLEILIYQENKDLIADFFQSIQSEIINIIINTYGTRVIQKVFEKMCDGIYERIETPILEKIIQDLINTNLLMICSDKNGNHVFQKILKIYPKNKNEFIFKSLISKSVEISKLKQGVSILQVAINIANEHQKFRLLFKIINNISILIDDRYANYAIQYILELNIKRINDKIYDFVATYLLPLSKSKFSSNVIDKILNLNGEMAKQLIVLIIENKYVGKIICDQYGNYVIQHALEICDNLQLEEMLYQIMYISDILNHTNIGKKVYENLLNKYPEVFNKICE